MITIELRKLRHLKIAPMVLGMLFLLCLFNIGNFGANRIKDLAAELSGIGIVFGEVINKARIHVH